MNSPPPITSRANRRTRSRDDSSTPLLRSIGHTTTERRKKEEAEQQAQRLHVVSMRQCWCIYVILVLVYVAVFGAVYLARSPDAFVPPLPDMFPGQTAQGQFNPYTAWEHLEAISTTPHPFNSRVNTNVTKEYILDQFQRLKAETVALGRKNVRYFDRVDNSTWTRLQKSKQQQQMEERGETEPSDGEKLQPEVLEVIQGDNLVMWVGGIVESMEGGVPVKIEIDFDQESQTALLVSAHYDSVPTSFGKTDDGGGVAVTLAMIRHFIHNPVQHTLIFNINNAEELGSYGAAAFMGAPPNSTTEFGAGHPWKKYIRAFVNLEGGGSGGPSLLFRATHHNIIHYYAKNAPFPHASVFANDVFRLHLINSDTDYSIYIQHGLPGLDIAFYQRRSMYHSTTDDLPIQSLFHMGSNTQATITGLCNSDYLDSVRLHADLGKESAPLLPHGWFSGKSVFYDLLGKYMVFLDLRTCLLLNVLIGFGLPVLMLIVTYVAQAIRHYQENNRQSRPSEQQVHSLRNVLDLSSRSMTGYSDDGYGPPSPRYGSTRQHGRYSDLMDSVPSVHPRKADLARTTVLVALIVVFDLAAIFAASKWQWYNNLLARHAQPWLALLGLAGVLLIVQTLAVYTFTLTEASIFGPIPIVRGATQWTLALGVWWWIVVLVVGTCVAGWFGTGALYGTTALAACSGVAALLQILLNHANKAESIDGSRFGWVAVLVASLLFPGITILDLIVVVVHMTAQILIANDTGIMYVIYDAGVGHLRRMLKDVPILEDDDKCTPFPTESSLYPEGCRFLPARQVFEDEGRKQPVRVDWDPSPKRGLDGWREGRLRVFALESRACSIHLAETAPGYETQLWMDRDDGTSGHIDSDSKDGIVFNHRAKTLRAIVRDWNRAWFAIVRVKDLQLGSDKTTEHEPVPLKVVCTYNDWSEGQGHASAFNEIRSHIPEWTRMKSYERDLFSVGVDLEV
ncbi:hypothetical protein BGZ65_001992 [Modicella reniformis]|uniref:Peptide hydrolase n=1 Tax=Modicella reniformis TaxID=1440133 RepID=A0A9P6MIN8_9FUNG|nr:hypothetical protein BGZ65_001992 [Modicella reniformis]